MQRLFLKLFSWFWATVMGAAVTLALIFRLGPGATPERWHVAWVCALIVSGLICYLLTRYLTGPVLRLQEAARLLAAGDLQDELGGSFDGAGTGHSQPACAEAASKTDFPPHRDSYIVGRWRSECRGTGVPLRLQYVSDFLLQPAAVGSV